MQAKWGESCKGAKAAAAELEVAIKRSTEGIKTSAAEEIARIQKAFAKEVDKILGL